MVLPCGGLRFVACCAWVLVLTTGVAAGSGKAAPAAEPVTGPDLVLWLDAQDIDGDGDRSNDPAYGSAIARWADKSDYANHATQTASQAQPVYTQASAAPARGTVRFTAGKRQHLSVRNGPSLDLSHITAFVVARASGHTSNMWLFGKNSFSSQWTGYGIAVHHGQVTPWPHLGLGHAGTSTNGYFRYDGNIQQRLTLVEIAFDGRRLYGLLNGRVDKAQRLAGGIQSNDRNLLIGASPQSLPAVEFLQGEIAEILLYKRALDEAARGRTRGYLAAKYGLTVADDSGRMVVIDNGYLPVLVENPATPETRTLVPQEAAARLRRDWLFQAGNQPTVSRSLQEIQRARQVAARLAERPLAPDLSQELGDLDALEKRSLGFDNRRDAGNEAQRFYLAVRRVKRQIMFKNPAVDFTQVLFIDQPYPQGPEWRHQAIHRLGHRATPGGRLLILEGLDPSGRVRRLGPQKAGSYWRQDLSFDGQRVLFCYKAHDEKSFHLYEINLDGTGLRQLTRGDYDDIDPIYLPDGHILFTTTRGNTYVRCGPYIYSYILARCDADGSNVYLISRNSEPDFVPSLMSDGRVIYSRWEYTDKSVFRVQSLWTTSPDGTGTRVFWGNQSVWPDHTAEPRQIPGSHRVMFSAVGHHDWFSGCIGIIDPSKGFNFPAGLTKVTWDLNWPEVTRPPVDPREAEDYHASGGYTSYKTPYPLSEEDFLVSARGEGDKFRLYLMDVHGNRELIYEGAHNVWHAIPVKSRRIPPRLPDQVAWPGTDRHRGTPELGILYNPDVYQGVPDLARGTLKYLRVVQSDAKTYSTWFKTFRLSGPPVSIVYEESVKRILSTVPVEEDGSVYFKVPPGRALHFQLLDEQYRCLQTMRSFTGVMPGERRGCVGCHESHSTAPPKTRGLALRRPPRELAPPPWGTESISYERFAQPVLDRYCGKCHQGDGEARKDLDLTLRPGVSIFKEPYLTLVGSAGWGNPVRDRGQPGYGIAGAIPAETMDESKNDPRALATLRTRTMLSSTSRLIEIATNGKHYDVQVDPPDLRRLIAWVDANCPYAGEQEVRSLDDPDFAGIEDLPIRPRVKTAPVIERP